MEYIKKYKSFEIFYEDDINMFTTFIDDLDVSANSLNLLQEKITNMKKENPSIKYTPEYIESYVSTKDIPGNLANFMRNFEKKYPSPRKSNLVEFDKISDDPYPYMNKHSKLIENLRYLLIAQLAHHGDYLYELWIRYDGNPKHNNFMKETFELHKKKLFEKMRDYLARVCLSSNYALGYCLFTGIAFIRNNIDDIYVDLKTHNEKEFIKELKKIIS